MQKSVMPQTDFDEHITVWKNMDRTTRDASNAAIAFYDENIFPLVKEVFINKNRPQKKYDALILTVGLSPEPLILSILAIKPTHVGLLYTNETERSLERILQEAELTLSQLAAGASKIDGSNVTEIYEAIMALYTGWNSPANIAVDITGGKKSMVSGAAMAGAVLGADIYYVDTNHFDRDLGKPEPGSEFLSLLDNPYTVFGDMEAEKANDLYQRHDYAGAQRIFDRLQGQVGDAYKAKVYEAYALLCTTYEAWDNLDIGRGEAFLGRLFDLLNQFPRLDGLSRLYAFQSCLVKQKEALSCLRQLVADPQVVLSIPDGFHFAFTLYYNALRREEQGKLDLACLILYRLLEWIGQHRLAQHGINTHEPDYSKICEDMIFNQYKEKETEIFGRSNRSTLPTPIGLVDGFLILHALDDPIVNDLDWGKFRNQVETRNQNIYAHGMSRIDSKAFNAFQKTVNALFTKAQELADINANTFREQHKFIVL